MSHNAGVPGVPMDRPELTTVLKLIAVPAGVVKVVGVKVLGAVSRPSMVVTLCDLAS